MGRKYLQMLTSVVANLETGTRHPVGFGSEYKPKNIPNSW